MPNNTTKIKTDSRFNFSRRTRTNSLPSFHSTVEPTAPRVPEDPEDYVSPSDYLSAVSIALMGGKFIAGQFYIPGIMVVCEAAIKMVNALRDAQLNNQEAFRLVKLMSNYINLLLDHASELSSIRSSSTEMTELTKNLETFERICSQVKDVASRITDRNVFVGIFTAGSDKEELQNYEEGLKDVLGPLQILCKMDRNVLEFADQMKRLRDRLDELQVASIPPPYQCPSSDCRLISDAVHMGLDVVDPTVVVVIAAPGLG